MAGLVALGPPYDFLTESAKPLLRRIIMSHGSSRIQASCRHICLVALCSRRCFLPPHMSSPRVRPQPSCR